VLRVDFDDPYLTPDVHQKLVHFPGQAGEQKERGLPRPPLLMIGVPHTGHVHALFIGTVSPVGRFPVHNSTVLENPNLF